MDQQASKKNYLVAGVAGLVLLVGVGAYLMSGGETLQGNLRAARSPQSTLEGSSRNRPVVEEEQKGFSNDPLPIYDEGSFQVSSISGKKFNKNIVTYYNFKSPITVNYLLPTYSDSASAGYYTSTFDLQLCDSSFSDCKSIAWNTWPVYKNSSDKQRFQTMVVEGSVISKYVKKLGTSSSLADGGLGLRMHSTDPNGSDIYTEEYILDVPKAAFNSL